VQSNSGDGPPEAPAGATTTISTVVLVRFTLLGLPDQAVRWRSAAGAIEVWTGVGGAPGRYLGQDLVKTRVRLLKAYASEHGFVNLPVETFASVSRRWLIKNTQRTTGGSRLAFFVLQEQG
jgi:hypothetical protein